MAEVPSRRHSADLKELASAELPTVIQAGVEELRTAFPDAGVRCLSWNDNYIAVVMELSVDLPSRGPVDDLDIRAVEPVLLLLHKRRYPRTVPLAYSDRKDFPAARLPHLIPTATPDLTAFCLHRGNLDDWFAEHSLTNFVGRGRGWLRDAASNRLMREEDRFEGTRIEDAIGIIVYPPEELISTVEDRWKDSGGEPGTCYVMVTLLENQPAKKFFPARISYRVDFAFPERPSGALIDLFQRYNRVVGQQPQEDRLLLGLLVWPRRTPVVEYFGSVPTSYGGLKDFCNRLGIDLEAAVEDYHSVGAQLLGGVPLVVAVLRPQLLIGASSAVELLHFTILASEQYCEGDGRWKDEAPVLTLSHRTPLTVAFAREMSREPGESSSPFALVGCGAVGSKLSLHLARAGHVRQVLIDPANLSPHHLVRHGLPPEYVGKNKAEALAAYIASTYRLDREHLAIRTHEVSIYDLFDGSAELGEIPFIIDATASSAVASALIAEGALPAGVHYSRCEITDEGRLGLLLWEGPARNPRLDDLQACLFSLGQGGGSIMRWLQRHRRVQQEERAAALEEIGIGISCSSTTLRLADDVVSFHASLFSATYKLRDRWAKEPMGRIQISVLDVGDVAGAGAQTVMVPPVTVLAGHGSGKWEVRVHWHALEKITAWMKKAGKRETGGLLLGFAHKKRKIIYVTDALPPSRDSKGTPYAFKRGVKDYPEILDEVAARTGDLIGYVGEWHTHPDGPADLSPTDLRAVEEIRRNLDVAGLPTHIIVCARDGIGSFVFSPDD